MGRGRAPQQRLALLQPLTLPSDCMLGQPGTPPAHPHSARAGQGLGQQLASRGHTHQMPPRELQDVPQ